MSGPSFITGSRAYGAPDDTSDWDLVVWMCAEEARQLAKALGVDVGYDSALDGGFACRVGVLNLLIVTSHNEFEAWREGTERLARIKRDVGVPISRSHAKAYLKPRVERARNPLGGKT